jgi:hypothetical protein
VKRRRAPYPRFLADNPHSHMKERVIMPTSRTKLTYYNGTLAGVNPSPQEVRRSAG